jgi:yeast amino acid transporter
MASLTIIGCLTPYTGPNLLNGASSSDADASPFAVVVRNASIGDLSSVMNVVIMIAVCTVGGENL